MTSLAGIKIMVTMDEALEKFITNCDAGELRAAGIVDVIKERGRQVGVERFSGVHDDCHDPGILAKAAACYCGSARLQLLGAKVEELELPSLWPWEPEWWRPKNPRRDLVRAAALIIAEIDRLDRAGTAS